MKQIHDSTRFLLTSTLLQQDGSNRSTFRYLDRMSNLMTLALSSCCSDGVAIIEDTRIYKPFAMEKDKISYSEKLRGVILNVIFGYSGIIGMYDLFVRYVVGDLVILRDDPDKYTAENMILKFCGIMDKFRELYTPFELQIIVGRQFPKHAASDLYLIKSSGDHEPIPQWNLIGERTIAEPLVRALYNEDKIFTMRDFAELSYCIIKYIEKREPNGTVGTGGNRPSIRYLKHYGDIDVPPSDTEFLQFEGAYGEYEVKFNKILT